MADGLLDIVVVHRLDRLSRHLGDFNALMQDFERHSVALVSVTQSIDTSVPQGRLTLLRIAVLDPLCDRHIGATQ